jgi:hypothetical protein
MSKLGNPAGTLVPLTRNQLSCIAHVCWRVEISTTKNSFMTVACSLTTHQIGTSLCYTGMNSLTRSMLYFSVMTGKMTPDHHDVHTVKACYACTPGPYFAIY